MIRHELRVEAIDATLAGELVLPSRNEVFPIVLMVHGSGPLDRDENLKRQKLNVFNTLAEQLATVGIASFRYDKRGCGKSTGNYLAAGHFDLVADASACVKHLRSTASCDRAKLFVLGHSEGTAIAVQLASLHSELAGLILLCPFVERMEPILRRQAQQIKDDLKQLPRVRRLLIGLFFHLFGDPVASQDKLIAKLKSTNTPTFRRWFVRVNAKWLRELMSLDIERLYSQTNLPMLVIGGEKDLQCQPADVQKISDLSGGEVETHVIENLTHLLRFDYGEHTFLRYQDLIRLPMEPAIGTLVSAWIHRQIGDSENGDSQKN